ncbi:hypothetical protein V8E53_014175 [Lactarius tabidus]
MSTRLTIKLHKHLENSHFGGIDNPIITAVVSLTVQGYFCHCIWSLKGWSSWICWIIAVVWSISSALVDVLIAMAMTLLVHHHFGLLFSSLAITILVLYAAFPNKLYYVFLHGDSAYFMASDWVHTTMQTSLCFAIPEPQSRTPVGDSFQLRNMTQTVELGMGKGEDTSLNSSQLLAFGFYESEQESQNQLDLCYGYYIKVPQASGPKIKVVHVAEEAEPGLAAQMQMREGRPVIKLVTVWGSTGESGVRELSQKSTLDNALVKDPIPYLLILKEARQSLLRVAQAMKEVRKTAMKPTPPEKLAAISWSDS